MNYKRDEVRLIKQVSESCFRYFPDLTPLHGPVRSGKSGMGVE